MLARGIVRDPSNRTRAKGMRPGSPASSAIRNSVQVRGFRRGQAVRHPGGSSRITRIATNASETKKFHGASDDVSATCDRPAPQKPRPDVSTVRTHGAAQAEYGRLAAQAYSPSDA